MRSSLARCVAQALGCQPHELPLPDAGQDPWDALLPALGARGLAPVPVPAAATFGWSGPWIARLEDGRFVLRFGTPDSGTIDDPQGGPPSPIVAGWVLAPLDLAAWTPPQRREPGVGTLTGIVVARGPAAPCERLERAIAVPGLGLEGDRYWAGTGSMGTGRPGMEVTLVDHDVLEELGIPPEQARRNLVTRGVDLDALIGRRFTVGAAVLEGRRRCEPCAHLQRIADRPVLKPLVHRGGLRADVVTGGELVVGDPVGPV